MSENSSSNNSYKIPLVLCLGLAGGIFLGSQFSTNLPAVTESGKDVQKFRDVLTVIQQDYVDEVSTDTLVDKAIEYMLTQLDPHSTYISSRDTAQANESLRGNFDGIGVEFNIFNDTITVVTPLSGGPSEALGIRSGDKIVKVDSINVAGIGITSSDVMRYLKGPRGTEVKVSILRKGQKQPIEYTIVRDKIPTFSLDVAYMIDNQTGYIKVSRFSATTYSEFEKSLTTLRSKGMKRLVLDLQGNPGGYMDMAINMLDDFLPAGKKVVFTKGKKSRYDQEAFSTEKGQFEKGDLIVLVNEGSASASEIVAGALQDNDRALVVGRRSFGKGLVQTTFPLSGGGEMRLTISRYYTPSGRSIQKPYENYNEYERDMAKRFKRGEFFSADSITFNDSLKYQTANGRTVYGGGGIMPDYFVPLDTTQNSEYLSELYIANVINEYTFDYADKNRSMLQALTFEKYFSDFIVTDAMLTDLVEAGKKAKVKPNPKDLAKHKALFQLHVKAQIARKIWGNEGFYPLFNQTNEVLQQALKLLDQPHALKSKM
ncbi:MAG: S41 family peptidase [Cyclobacteriaceae bacterium]|jgi:carboxyl-terminal processing protease|nr:S41 family peptidase [Cytophagales bacterium]MCZ8328763.1 S41 family peptidase [Cyclobacteriaceae bacterium]